MPIMMSIMSLPPGVCDWQTSCSPSLTTSPFPSSVHTRLHSLASLLTQSHRKMFTCPSLSQWTLCNVNETLNIYTYEGSVFPRHPIVAEVYCLYKYMYSVCVLLGLINTSILPIGWSAGRLTARRNKHGSVLVCACVCMLLSMNCSDLCGRLEPQEANTGKRSLFGLSVFAFKPLLPFFISLPECTQALP